MSENDAFDGLEGSPVDASALAGNPFERKTTWRSAFRVAGTRGWAAVALGAGVLALGWHLRPTAPTEATVASGAEGIARLEAADPRALRQQIVADLSSAGVQANGYEQLGINGVDGDLPQPMTNDVRRVLEKYRIPVPPDSSLRIEISAR